MESGWKTRIFENYFSDSRSPYIESFLDMIPTHMNDHYYDVVEYIFARIDQAGFSVDNIVPYFFQATANVLSQNSIFDEKHSFVPPITTPNRHGHIDQHILDLCQNLSSPHLLDIGCGFPPVSTVASSKILKKFQITGADPAFYPHLIQHTSGNYACFDHDHNLRFLWDFYGHGLSDSRASDKEVIKEHFISAAKTLFASSDAKMKDYKLITNPIESYKTPSLDFINGGFGAFDPNPGSIDIARIFNVLVYYPDAKRDEVLRWLAPAIKDHGYLIVGTNWERGLYTCFTQYRKNNTQLTPHSVHISIDCFYPMTPYLYGSMTKHYIEADAVTKWTALIHAQSNFSQDFYERYKTLLIESGLFQWDDAHHCWSDYCGPHLRTDMYVLKEKINQTLIKEGFLDQMTEILKSKGHQAHSTAAGFLQIDL